MNDQEWYGIGLDTSQLKKDAQSVRNEFSQIGNTAYNEGMRIDRTFQNLYRGAIAYLSVQQMSLYTKQIIQIRGEFQQLSIAFETMLGSKEKADRLMAEQIALAQKSPFTLLDVANNTKQLLAMGIEVENVMDTMKALGDVAAGVSQPISRIAINYGQVATLGKLQTREIRDFAMAGIPLIDELARNLGKTRSEIDKMVEESKIGFPEVEKAFQTMSSEGGKFYNLMEKQNKSVTGQISNLTDKYQVMLNKIGQSNEGLIYSGINGLNELIDNYEEILAILKTLAVGYGTYKAALIAVSAYEAALAKVEFTRAQIIAGKVAVLKAAFLVEDQQAAKSLANAAKEQAAAVVSESIEKKKQASAVKTAAAREAVTIATAKLTVAEQALAEAQLLADKLYGSGANASVMKKLATESQLIAVETERANVAKVNAALDKAIASETVVNANIEATAVKKSEAEKIAAKKAGIQTDRERIIASQAATNAEVRSAAAGGIWKTLTSGANPYIIAAIGITTLISALTSLRKETEDIAKVSTDFTNSLSKQTEEVKKDFKAITEAKDGTIDRAKAIQTVNDKYKDYLPNLLAEKDSLDKVKEAQDAVTTSLAKTLAFKAQSDLLTDKKTKVDNELTDFYWQIDRITKKLPDAQKGQIKALIEQYKEQVAITFKDTGLMSDTFSTDLYKIFNKVTGGSIGTQSAYNIKTSIVDLIRSEVELENQTESLKNTYSSYLKELGLTDNSSQKSEDALKTIQQQIIETTKSISEAEAKLAEMRAPGSVSTISDIETQEKSLKDLKGKLETLTGIKQKEIEKQIKSEEDKLNALAELKQKEIDLELEYSQAVISAMADGFEKQKELAKQEYKERLVQLEKNEKEYLEKLNDSKGLKSTDKGYISSLSEYVSKTPNDTVAVSFLQNLNNLRMAADKAYVNASDKLNDEKKQNENDSMNEYLKEFGNYQQKRLAIAELYAGKIAKAETEGEKLSLAGQRDKEIQELDQFIIEKSGLWTRLFEDAERHTTKYIEETINQAQQLIDYLNGIEGVQIPIGFSEEQINNLKKDPEALKQILAGLTRQRDELDKRNPFKNIIKGFQELKKAAKGSNDEFAATNKIINGLEGAAGIIGSVADAFGSVDEEAGKALSKISDVIGQTSSFAEMGAQVGGAYVAIIGGALGLITSLAKVISDSKKEREAAEAERQAVAMEKLNTSIELNNELLKNTANANYWAVMSKQVEDYEEKIKTLNDNLKDAIPKYTNDVYEKYADDYQKYLDSKYWDIEYARSSGASQNDLNRIRASILSQNDWLKANLSPVMYPSTELWSFEQIRDAWLKGELELSKEAEQIMLDLVQTQQAQTDMLMAQYQNFLGFAKSDITSAISGGIAEGLQLEEDGLGEFAQGFGELMKKYAGTSLEKFLNEKYLNDMYENAFEFSKTGGIIDEDERKALEKMYADAVAAGQSYYDSFKGLFTDASGKGYNVLTGTTVNATEESVSALYGMTTAIRIDLKGIGTDILAIDENTRQATDYLMKGLVIWEQIAENTSYNKNLVPIHEELQKMNKTLIEKLS